MGQFVTELHCLSEYCEFGCLFDEMLRDRLVCGLRDVRVQRRLFAKPKLTFTKAFELAQAAELAEKCSQDISRAGASVNALEPRRATAGQTADHPTPCFRCGGRHSASKCCFRSVECRKCSEKGHLALVWKWKQFIPEFAVFHQYRYGATHWCVSREATRCIFLSKASCR